MASFIPQNLYSLSGRVALVTGGGTGIGLMMARGLGAAGAKVYIAGRRKEVLDKIVSSWDKQHGTAVALQLDVTNRASISAAQETIAKKEGKLHILVNNAGVEGPCSPFFNDLSAPEHADAETLGKALFEAESPEAWAECFKTNTASPYFVTVRFLGLLAKGSQDDPRWTSSVINLTSISGIVKLAQRHFCYNASKAAADHLTTMMSTEFALKKIPVRVNSIAPGVYESEMTFAAITTPEEVAKVAQSIQPVPAGRVGTAEEVAGTAVYFSSKAGAYATGQIMVIDGGYLAVNPARA